MAGIDPARGSRDSAPDVPDLARRPAGSPEKLVERWVGGGVERGGGEKGGCDGDLFRAVAGRRRRMPKGGGGGGRRGGGRGGPWSGAGEHPRVARWDAQPAELQR